MDPILEHELTSLHEEIKKLTSWWSRVKALFTTSDFEEVTDHIQTIMDYQNLKGMIEISVEKSPVMNTVAVSIPGSKKTH